MKIEKAKRYCRYKYGYCKNPQIWRNSDRVDLSQEYMQGFAHPICAVKMFKEKIDSYIKFRNEVIEKFHLEIMMEEL